ncbi:HAMP domain-containing sensor histidine kinase (plasmid) [Tistrella bauzanensis]|uniref:sensor histidine kinase n=1 Tax=Tistrella TaxID=171436 RepID=UPI0031F7202D
MSRVPQHDDPDTPDTATGSPEAAARVRRMTPQAMSTTPAALRGLVHSLATRAGARQVVVLRRLAGGRLEPVAHAEPPSTSGADGGFRPPSWMIRDITGRPVILSGLSVPRNLCLPMTPDATALCLDADDVIAVFGWATIPDAASVAAATEAWEDLCIAIGLIAAQNPMATPLPGQPAEWSADMAEARRQRAAAATARSHFLGRMNHELRTPLNAIIGFSELIRYQALGPAAIDRYMEYVNDIHVSGLHLLRLVDDLLDLARIETGGFDVSARLCPLAEIVRHPVAAARKLARQGGVHFSLEAAPELTEIRADPDALPRALTRLLIDAIDAALPGGTVRLIISRPADTEAGTADHDHPQRPGTGDSLPCPGTGACRIVVETDGCLALADDPSGGDMARLTDPTIHRRDGTGIDLPLVQDLVELHGGRMTLRANEAVTRVVIDLPGLR